MPTRHSSQERPPRPRPTSFDSSQKPGLRGALPDLQKTVPALMPNAEYVKFRLTHAALLGPLTTKSQTTTKSKKKAQAVHKTSSLQHKDQEKESDSKNSLPLQSLPSAPRREETASQDTTTRTSSAHQRKDDVTQESSKSRLASEATRPENAVVTSSGSPPVKAAETPRTNANNAAVTSSRSAVKTPPGELSLSRKAKDLTSNTLSFFDQAMRSTFSPFSASATFAHAHQAIDNYGLFASVAQRGQHATPTTTSRSCHSSAFDASRYSYKASSSAFMEKVQEKMNESSRRLEASGAMVTPTQAPVQRSTVTTKNVHRIMFSSTYPSDRAHSPKTQKPAQPSATKTAKSKGSLFGTKSLWLTSNTNVMRTTPTHSPNQSPPATEKPTQSGSRQVPAKAFERSPPK